ncbi:MAG: peptidoglycan DD-metalloendopeptidase family protein [Propionibacteriaceae bacterium]
MPDNRIRKVARTIVALVATCAVGFTIAMPSASADELDDRKAKVTKQLKSSKQQLNESTSELKTAASKLEESQGQLDVAKAELAETQRKLAVAKEKDVEMAAKLKKAQEQLEKAKAAVKAGQKKVDAAQEMAGQQVRDSYQQQTNLLPIALLVENSGTSDMAQRLQWSTTMFDAQDSKIKNLEKLQRQLNAKRAEQTRIEAQMAVDRKKAAENLKVSQSLEEQAAAQEASVAELVRSNSAAKEAASSEVSADKKRYEQLQSERSKVEQRIAARIAEQKRQEAAAAKRAAEERAAKQRQQASSKKKSNSSNSSSSSGSSKRKSSPRSSSNSGSFQMPVNGPITSSYGMRLHPVLGYWKLHDGTDFGAGCGATIRAPYSGRVSEKYFNAGYGNRLLIDHGRVNGSYITTAYNHAIRYTVGVGQHVSKGQTIGYVGTTGYSTGCHLHLMAWKNGSMINPMSWF